jgi:hypothetical protein
VKAQSSLRHVTAYFQLIPPAPAPHPWARNVASAKIFLSSLIPMYLSDSFSCSAKNGTQALTCVRQALYTELHPQPCSTTFRPQLKPLCGLSVHPQVWAPFSGCTLCSLEFHVRYWQNNVPSSAGFSWFVISIHFPSVETSKALRSGPNKGMQDQRQTS